MQSLLPQVFSEAEAPRGPWPVTWSSCRCETACLSLLSFLNVCRLASTDFLLFLPSPKSLRPDLRLCLLWDCSSQDQDNSPQLKRSNAKPNSDNTYTNLKYLYSLTQQVYCKNCRQAKTTHTNVFCSLLVIAESWEQFKCPSIKDWLHSKGYLIKAWQMLVAERIKE